MTIQKILLLLFAATCLYQTVEAADLTRHTVLNAPGRQAVCNDGSPAVYYFRKGYGSGSKNWVVILGGGGFCYSVKSCKERWANDRTLMTSTDKPDRLALHGLLSDSSLQNPDFYNANQVVIPYCSSDLWSGDRRPDGATGQFEFRGREIARAVLTDLKNGIPGRSLNTAERVLFGGISAGGIGVMVHLDWLASKLPATTVKGLNDAGWFPDIDVPFFPDEDQYLNQAVQFWNGKPDASCARANSKSKYRCYLTSVFPYVKQPLLIQMSQHDSATLGALGVRPPFNAYEQMLADLLAAAIRDSLQNVPAAFSPKSYTHGLSPYSRFTTRKIDGYSLQEITGNWFFERPGPVKLIQ